MFGMVIGYADAVYEQIPGFIKAASILTIALASFFDLKSDIAVIKSQVYHAGEERREMQQILYKHSEQCSREDCRALTGRVQNLEREHMANGRSK